MSNIQDVRTINNPQKSYMWEVSVNGLLVDGAEDLAFYAKTVSIPQVAVEQMIINHKAAKTHYAGRDASAHTVTMTFWDDESQTIHKFLNDWMNLVISQDTGASSTRELHAADIVIRLKDASDESDTSKITLKTCFPMDIGEVALSYDSSEAVEWSVTFSFDTKVVE